MTVRRRISLVLVSLAALNLVLLLAGLGRGARSSCEGGLCVGLVFDVGSLKTQGVRRREAVRGR